MKLTPIMAAGAALFLFAHSAQAREHYHHRYHHHHRMMVVESGADESGSTFYRPFSLASTARGSVGSRPAAWCGWEMRQLVGNDPGPSYNLARNWAHWGHSGPAGVGAVVVWPHHVGKIVGGQDGAWVIESGNDGHALRTRSRSIAGAIAIRWG